MCKKRALHAYWVCMRRVRLWFLHYIGCSLLTICVLLSAARDTKVVVTDYMYVIKVPCCMNMCLVTCIPLHDCLFGVYTDPLYFLLL